MHRCGYQGHVEIKSMVDWLHSWNCYTYGVYITAKCLSLRIHDARILDDASVYSRL